MAVNVAVSRNGTESTPSLIRRFSKRVQGSGIVRRIKGSRYFARTLSKKKQRIAALRKLARDEKREEMERQGLIQPRDPRAPRGRK
jgi:ribosomal protein S21